MTEGDAALAVLVEGHLDTVSFVMNYIELRIGYSILRALNPPRVKLRDGTVATFPQPGSRDALCRLIDTKVVAAREVTDGPWRIEVETDRGDLLVVPIDSTDHPESAHLVPADERGRLHGERMYIW